MGKTAIVVGGTGGIGRSVVAALEKEGCRVAVVVRGTSQAIDTREGSLVCTYLGDATKEQHVSQLVHKIVTELGAIDYLVYAAGLAPDVERPLTEYAVADWDRTFDTYVKGFLLFFRSTLPSLNPGGHIVGIGSAITRFASDNLPPIHAGHYAAAKAALAELIKWARREAHTRNVLLSFVAPSAVDTSIHTAGVLGKVPKRLLPLDGVTNAILNCLHGTVDGDCELLA